MRVDSSVENELIYSKIKLFLRVEISEKYTHEINVSHKAHESKASNELLKAEGTRPF